MRIRAVPRVRPGPWTEAGFTDTSSRPSRADSGQGDALGPLLGALVVGQEVAAVGGAPRCARVPASSPIVAAEDV